MLHRVLCLGALLFAFSACGDDETGSTTPDASMDAAQMDASADGGALDGSSDGATGDAETDAHVEEICSTVAKYDSDGNETYERIIRTTEWTESYKHIAVYDTDSDADGTYDEREYSVRRDTGDASPGARLEQYFVDLRNDDKRVRITMEYDGEGRPSRQEFDNNFNGVINTVITWTYHGNGEVAETINATDVDQDGSFDGFTRRVYDEQGRLTRSETDSTAGDDPNGDAIDSWETWEYDGLTTKHSEFNIDGLIRYDENDYDEMERWLRQAESPNGDTDFEDTEDTVTTFTWDGNTRTGHTDGTGGTAPDGEWDFESIVVFDDDGWLIESKSRVRGGAFKDHSKRSYDADHNLLKEEWDDDGDGTFESYDSYTYSEYGDETSYETYRNGELSERRYALYAYDDNGNMTMCERDHDGDELLEELQTWARDEQGRVTRYTRDDRSDEIASPSVVDYEYICPADIEL